MRNFGLILAGIALCAVGLFAVGAVHFEDADAARTHAVRTSTGRLKAINDVLDEHDTALDNVYGPATHTVGTVTNTADGGTISATFLTNITITVGDGGTDPVVTLGSGTATGQRKRFMLSSISSWGASAVVTPTAVSGWTSAKLHTKWSWVEMEWNGSAWILIGHSGATIT